MASQPGFFDLDARYALLSDGGAPLERLSQIVSFEDFRPLLEDALERKDRNLGGRPPMDAVMMFKILVLQSLYNLGDDAAEYLIRDRLSFMGFLGLGLADKWPDAKTIWLYREHWTQAGVVEALFERFDRVLRDGGFLAMAAKSWMPRSCGSRRGATAGVRTRRSSRARFPAAGRTNPTRGRKKIWTPAGQRSTARVTSATRTM